MKYLALLIVFSCSTSTTASVRRMAEKRLAMCLSRAGDSTYKREACKQESYDFCLKNMPKNHIEKGCGLGWAF